MSSTRALLALTLALVFLAPPGFAQRTPERAPTQRATVNGYVRDVLQELPMEFAVEAQSLLKVSLEGSVG